MDIGRGVKDLHRKDDSFGCQRSVFGNALGVACSLTYLNQDGRGFGDCPGFFGFYAKVIIFRFFPPLLWFLVSAAIGLCPLKPKTACMGHRRDFATARIMGRGLFGFTVVRFARYVEGGNELKMRKKGCLTGSKQRVTCECGHELAWLHIVRAEARIYRTHGHSDRSERTCGSR
jgi:hypothetical protein